VSSGRFQGTDASDYADVAVGHRHSLSGIQRLRRAWHERGADVTVSPGDPVQDRRSTSAVQRQWQRWRASQEAKASRRRREEEHAALLEHEHEQQEIIDRLEDPRRTPPLDPPLALLREVGLEQLSMQVAGGVVLVTQAGGAVAGASLLAAADIAVQGWLVVLLIAVLSAVFALRALLGVKPSTGPTPFQMLDGRNAFYASPRRAVLDDDEVEWLLIGDIEKAIHENEERLTARAKWVSRSIWVLLVGLSALAVQQVG